MASISVLHRKKGDVYRVTVFIGRTDNGKALTKKTTYTPKSTTPSTIKKEVEAFAASFEARVKNGMYLKGDEYTFEDFASVWASEWAPTHLTKSIQESYEGIQRFHVFPYIGAKKIGKITTAQCQQIINEMSNAGYKPKTIKMVFTAMRSVFLYAYRMSVIDVLPCDRCELPREKRDNKLHYFTLDQSKRFISCLDTLTFDRNVKEHTRVTNGETYVVKGYVQKNHIPLQFKAYFYLASFGPMRRGEEIGLKWGYVNFEKGTIEIAHATALTKEGQVEKGPKTEAGNRVLKMPFPVIAVLKELDSYERKLTTMRGWKGCSLNNWADQYVFIQSNGLQMSLHTPRNEFRKIINRYNELCENDTMKLPLIRLHDLRHTAATLMIAAGADIETVSKRMGHSKASVTLDIYAHAMEDEDVKASEMLNNMYFGGYQKC